jgi:hypothetical protein
MRGDEGKSGHRDPSERRNVIVVGDRVTMALATFLGKAKLNALGTVGTPFSSNGVAICGTGISLPHVVQPGRSARANSSR